MGGFGAIPLNADALIAHLRSLRNEANIAGQRRFGITPAGEHLGIAIPVLRKLARAHRNNHALARQLWRSGIHEARILAAYVDLPKQVSRRQMEVWASQFDSWDLCDQVCGNLFDRTDHAVEMAVAWTRSQSQFKKRAGFSLMAALAVHRKELPDSLFRKFIPLIVREADDDRNFVRKAVNWALRQIGKRNRTLRADALRAARALKEGKSRSARWIGADAVRELGSY